MAQEHINTAELIEKYKFEYKKLRPIYSTAIGDKIPLIVPVIRSCAEEKEIRIRKEIINGKKVAITYYALEAHVGKDGVRVRVVTRKVGNKGKHYFQSIMKY